MTSKLSFNGRFCGGKVKVFMGQTLDGQPRESARQREGIGPLS
jgi:hypothetical protein